MARTRRRTSKKAALSPGTLIHVGEKRTESAKISVVDYTEAACEFREPKTLDEVFPLRDSPTVSWINIDGIHQTDLIENIGKHFSLHPLVLEDIVNTAQRPKVEDYDTSLFFVLKMLSFDPSTAQIHVEQLSLVLGKGFLLSFQEKEGDVFNPIRERIRNAKGHHRRSGADYLAYSLVDAVVDNYFVMLETMGDSIEDLEEELVSNPDPEILKKIHRLKRNMIVLRKSIWPLREVISSLQRTGSKLILESTGIYLRDVYDHTIQVLDTVESFRDIVSGMLDTYLTGISNKMNEVMKVLTIIATIFIPITFIAGVYGMNFHHMPELEWQWLYPEGFWVLITFIVVAMVVFFRKKKWL